MNKLEELLGNKVLAEKEGYGYEIDVISKKNTNNEVVSYWQFSGLGRLGAQPGEITEKNGNKVTNVSFASAGVKGATDWFRLAFWNRMAEIIEKLTKDGSGKGKECVVWGTIKTSEFGDKTNFDVSVSKIAITSGNKTTTYETSDNGATVDKTETNKSSEQNYQSTSEKVAQNNVSNTGTNNGNDEVIVDEVTEDDIPF